MGWNWETGALTSREGVKDSPGGEKPKQSRSLGRVRTETGDERKRQLSQNKAAPGAIILAVMEATMDSDRGRRRESRF